MPLCPRQPPSPRGGRLARGWGRGRPLSSVDGQVCSDYFAEHLRGGGTQELKTDPFFFSIFY